MHDTLGKKMSEGICILKKQNKKIFRISNFHFKQIHTITQLQPLGQKLRFSFIFLNFSSCTHVLDIANHTNYFKYFTVELEMDKKSWIKQVDKNDAKVRDKILPKNFCLEYWRLKWGVGTCTLNTFNNMFVNLACYYLKSLRMSGFGYSNPLWMSVDQPSESASGSESFSDSQLTTLAKKVKP